ncbi:DUF3379 domain-containing protein [Paraneptunicella aestuarii]|uniref:DUF3379 family protein n=1 Tax=Paraneptunicella aestuarii TaxID=2831148 RepID=UPI001E3C9C5C|nr:DUF3379 family protein [Paraneptunicella aestuarii]UAA40101.1 DUF3379 domain-containing protein [Paraneptunicella aestuarii]
MDDLEFRRQVYADPGSKDPALLEAATQDPAKQQFWDEMKSMNSDIENALDVPVPSELAHRLILRQSIESHNRDRSRNRMHIALAASVAFVIGLSFTLFNRQPTIYELSDVALRHMYHEADYALSVDDNVPLADVNAKLASFGGELKEPFSRVYFASYCLFDKQRSLHLVLGNGADKFTVFITPKEDNEIFTGHFEDENYFGRAWQTSKMNVVVLAEKAKPTEQSMDEVRGKMLFSI